MLSCLVLSLEFIVFIDRKYSLCIEDESNIHGITLGY